MRSGLLLCVAFIWQEDATMDMLLSLEEGLEADEAMARGAKVIDDVKVERVVSLLSAHVSDAGKFRQTLESIASDRSLGSAELIEIAYRFVGGKRQKSGKAALLSVAQERLRISHAVAKGVTASKTRVW
jgi:hypothetical protein